MDLWIAFVGRVPVRALLVAAAAAAVTATSSRADVPEEARKGAELFADSSYSEAADAFRQATIASPDDARWRYDLGLSEALGQQYENALNNLNATARVAPPEVAAASLYNAGNVHLATGKFAEAAQAFRQALLRNPGDVEAKHNLELALRQLQKEQEQSKESPGSGKDSTQQQNQQDQKDKNDQKQQDSKEQQPPDPSKGEQQPDSSGQTPPPDARGEQASDSTLSREQAERILRALADEEARLRSQAKNVIAIPAPGGKDW